MHVDVVAVLNDTTATLMSCAYDDNLCQIGVIVGTGTNACYIEQISRAPKLHREFSQNDDLPNQVSQYINIAIVWLR